MGIIGWLALIVLVSFAFYKIFVSPSKPKTTKPKK